MAVESRTIDSFEDDDLSEYGGDSSPFSIVQDTPGSSDGDYYLSSSGTNNALISSTSGLDNYPGQGNTFAGDLKMMSSSDSSSQVGFVWAMQSEVDWNNREGYAVTLTAGGGQAKIERFDTGDSTDLDTSSASLSTDTWYTVEITWETDGSITVSVTDESDSEMATLSATDSNHGGGGVGWVTIDDNSDEMRYDNGRIV